MRIKLTSIFVEDQEGVELVLEPSDNPAAKTCKKSLYEQGIPAAAFAVNSVQGEYARLKELSVEFVQEPTKMGETTQAVFDDTCGNLIQVYQV